KELSNNLLGVGTKDRKIPNLNPANLFKINEHPADARARKEKEAAAVSEKEDQLRTLAAMDSDNLDRRIYKDVLDGKLAGITGDALKDLADKEYMDDGSYKLPKEPTIIKPNKYSGYKEKNVGNKGNYTDKLSSIYQLNIDNIGTFEVLSAAEDKAKNQYRI